MLMDGKTVEQGQNQVIHSSLHRRDILRAEKFSLTTLTCMSIIFAAAKTGAAQAGQWQKVVGPAISAAQRARGRAGSCASAAGQRSEASCGETAQPVAVGPSRLPAACFGCTRSPLSV